MSVTCPHGLKFENPKPGDHCPACDDVIRDGDGDPITMTPDQRETELRRIAGSPLFSKFTTIHERIERLAGVPVWTHEMGNLNYLISLCRERRRLVYPLTSLSMLHPDKKIIPVVIEEAE